MTDNTQHTLPQWTEVNYTAICKSPYLSTPFFVPKESEVFLCRENGSREQKRLLYWVFKPVDAPEDAEWEDDPIPGEMWLTVLADDDEEVEPVRVVYLDQDVDDFIRVSQEDDTTITFDIAWDYGDVKVEKSEKTDDGFVCKKEDFGEEGLLLTLVPEDGKKPFSMRLQIPYMGFSLYDKEGKKLHGDIEVPHDKIDDYTYDFVGDDNNDRFSLHLDNDKLVYMCVLRQHEAKLVVRDQRERLAIVDELPVEGKLSQLLMNAHEALVKNKNNRWRVTLEGNGMDDASDLKCDPVELSRFAFTKFSECDEGGEDDLAHRLMAMEQRMAFQWYWLNEHDWSHEHMDGLIDMEGIDADPEKMMRQALLFNRFESFMKRLTAFSYVSQKPIQGDQLQARNNKRKIARCAKRVLAHRAGTESIWGLDEEARREILHFSATFHREFTAALEELGA